MMKTLPTMTEEEVSRCPSPAEAGFGSLSSERGPLPLKAMDIQARIDGLIVQIALQQTFVNTHAEPLEATYIFPLPDRAAVTRFRLEVAGRVIEGTLKERGAARQEYNQAIEAGHRAAITEEERPGVFTMRVGNLPPGEAARVQLTLAGPLPYSDGEATFRFPFVVAPRYIPGAALPGPSVGDGVAADTDAVPDASRISPPVLLPGFPNPVRLSLRVDFASSMELADLRSSLHSILEEASYPIRRVVLQPGERLNRDFVLRFRLAEDHVKTSLSIQPDADGREGTFLLTLVPPRTVGTTRPRDVVFVLDRSGSMEGWKMVVARRAMGRMVDTLTERDRFTVLAFDNSVERPPEFAGQLVSGLDRHRFQAVEFLARIGSRGGTEMAEPLEQAVAALNKDVATGRERVLVLVTDGQVGNEDQILQHLGAKAKSIRIFTLGIDRAVNAAFLRRLSDLGGGASEVVESEERLDEVMDQVHRHIGTPVLTGLRLEPAGLQVVPGSVVPGRLPDLFAGAPLLVMGRYQGAPQGAIALQGRDAAGQPYLSHVAAQGESSAALASVWARGRLRELEDRYVIAGGDRSGLEREIVSVSLRFGVLCRFTSYVAVDRSAVVNPGGQVQSLVQPVEQPDGWGCQNATMASMPMPCAAAPAALFCAPADANADMDLTCDEEEAARSLNRKEARSFQEKRRAAPPAKQVLRDAAPAPSAKPLAGRGAAKGQAERQQDRAAAAPGQSAAAPEAQLPSLLQRFLSLFGLGKKDKATASQPIDREPFRSRVQELFQAMAGCPTTLATHRLDLLRSLSPRLQQLCVDLVNAGDQHPTLQQLGERVLALQQLLSEAQPADAAITVLWGEIEAALRDYLDSLDQPAAAPESSRREGFWK